MDWHRQIFLRRISSHLAFLFLLISPLFNINAQDGGVEGGVTSSPEYTAGLSLWEANCTSCHKVDAKLIGPALRGASEKYDREWIYEWVKNSSKMVKSGDPQAVAIYKEYNESVMTAFPMLSNEDIDNILTYVDNAPVAVAAGATTGPIEDPCAAAEEAETFLSPPKEWSPKNLFLLVLTIVLFLISILTGKVVRSLDDLVREREGLEVKRPMTFARMLGSSTFKTVAGIAAFVLLFTTAFDQSSHLSYQKGYAPEQPIKFSHKLHACQYEIECQYCHVGAARGKSAVIPSANICMNCHKGIDEGPTYGKTEIAKIYDAVGWDAEKQAYAEDYVKKPIEWVRIHNLPDHVYFNHSQHVVAGGIDCQKCHGEVQTMEVVKQENTLGMGWCIDCHRETEVQFSNNEYYNIYEKYHEDIKAGKRTSVTVEDIGGTECQKCHY